MADKTRAPESAVGKSASAPKSKLHGLTWAPSNRFTVVFTYDLHGTLDDGGWGEGWSAVAFAPDGSPLVQTAKGLETPDEMVASRYSAHDMRHGAWMLMSHAEWPAGLVKRTYQHE